MIFNKKRLYVGLHARGSKATMPGQEDKYHWSLIIGPKYESLKSKGRRIHATNSLAKHPSTGTFESYWRHEDLETTMLPENLLLVRVLIAKVTDEDRLRTLFANEVPMRPDQEGWNCVLWVKEALEKAREDGRGVLGTSVSGGWQAVRDTALWYVESKKESHRFDGQGGFALGEERLPPMWDMLRDVEIWP